MAKGLRPSRPKAITPKGFRDYFGVDVTRRARMLTTISEVYQRYGFEALETSAVETIEALGKFLPDVDRPNEGVFAWQDEADGWVALRYDLTAPLARVYAQHRNTLPTPYRRYAMGPVWRNEKPGPGRFRQFYQCDADTVGAQNVAADAEICAMLCDCLEAVGIERKDYVVRINNRKVLNGVLELAGLSDEEHEQTRGIVLRAIDKLDRLGVEGVHALLGEGRTDESGDYTTGAGLTPAQQELLVRFVTVNATAAAQFDKAPERAKENASRTDAQPRANAAPPLQTSKMWNHAVLDVLKNLVGESETGSVGIGELAEMSSLLEAQGYSADRILIDPSVVRGLGYYTGPVFEAELTFEITDEKGRPRQFGSVAGGGRYDDLVKRFTGQSVPATGVSIGVDRLLSALEARRAQEGNTTTSGLVVVTVMDRERMADYQKMAAELRATGIRAEVYLGNPKTFGNQMKYADKRGAAVAVIEGTQERESGVVQLKDLGLGAALSQTASLEEWKERPSQIEVPRAELASRVLQMLRPTP